MYKKLPWYYNDYFIATLFLLGFFIIPLLLGLYLINKKNIIYDNLNDQYEILKNKYELSTLTELNQKIIDKKNSLDCLQLDYEELEKDLNKKHRSLTTELQKLSNEISNLEATKNTLSYELNLLNEEIDYIELGFYKPTFDYKTSEKFKKEINLVRTKQKNLVKYHKACSIPKNFLLDGSKVKGKKLLNDNVKLLLKYFNSDCDILISKVTYKSMLSTMEKVRKSYDSLNKKNSHIEVQITEDYLNLKILELKLTYEYELKKREEKEKEKQNKELLREEQRVLKEIQIKRKHILKEKKLYEDALTSLEKQYINNITNTDFLQKKENLLEKLNDIEKNLKDIDYRESNKRAGYVYVISNVGSLGKDVFKIGMTRRLEPLERISELSSASVPFKFDVHAMIFTDDAPKLENLLHKEFENKRINLVNNRKEFFNVSLSEIENVVKEKFDKTVEFIYEIDAQEYNESLALKKTFIKKFI